MKRAKFFSGLFIALALLFLLSLVLNIFLYSQLRNYYSQLYRVELDPLNLSYFQNSTQQAKPDNDLPTVVFFGDSRAAQWPNPDLNGFRFINRGIGNQTSVQILNRFEAHIKPLQPDIIVLELGINDLKTLALFPANKEEIVSNCMINIQEIVNRSLELNATVIVSTIFPTGKIPLARKLVWSKDIDKGILQVNNYIYSLQSEKVIIFDAAQVLMDTNGKMKQEYRFDELHLNPTGYQALNLELVKLLEQIKHEPQ